MLWLKKIPDLFGFGWLIEKIFTWRINKEIKKLDGQLRKKKVLVIDDDSCMKSYVEKFVEGVIVHQLYRIPDDLSVLLAYDAIVVDGLGISNDRFENGLDLCMHYDKPEGQSVVYHSGLGAYGNDARILSERGVAVVTKGSNPEKLSLAILFAMKKTEVKQDESRRGSDERIPDKKDIRRKMAKRRSMRKKRFHLAAH